jgi:hypothetical protein
MEIFIRGLVALGIALAVASLGFSQEPAAAATVDSGYGWAPRLHWIGHAKGCFGWTHGGLAGSGHGSWAGKGHGGFDGDPNNGRGKADRTPAPHSQPGTVVFPQHPFARSPRDYFMMD